MKNIVLYLLCSIVSLQIIAQNKNFIDQPYLETAAEIDTLVVPDRIHLLIILNEEDSRNRKSTEELEISMLRVLNTLQLDVEQNLSVLDYNSDFKKYFLGGKKILKTKMYSLIVKDAYLVGKVMTGLEREDISNVSINKVAYSKSEELQIQLKTKAIIKAKQNAEIMVDPLGQNIGNAIYISDMETESTTRQLQGRVAGVQIRGQSSRYGYTASEPFIMDFKKMRFSSKVKVTFSIE